MEHRPSFVAWRHWLAAFLCMHVVVRSTPSAVERSFIKISGLQANMNDAVQVSYHCPYNKLARKNNCIHHGASAVVYMRTVNWQTVADIGTRVSILHYLGKDFLQADVYL